MRSPGKISPHGFALLPAMVYLLLLHGVALPNLDMDCPGWPHAQVALNVAKNWKWVPLPLGGAGGIGQRP